jgi:hypothetical protein
MAKKAKKNVEAERLLRASTKSLAAIVGHKPVQKSVDDVFEQLTDVLRHCRHLVSRGICTDNSLVSCKLPNGINVSLMPKPLRTAEESTASLWSEYEEQKRRATERQQQADDPLRGSGRTTACILRTFAAALENPEKWVQFQDHASRSDSFESLQATASELSHKADLYGLTLDVGLRRDHVAVRSPLQRIRAERSHAAARYREVFGQDPAGEVEMFETDIGPVFIHIKGAPPLPPEDEYIDYGSGVLFPEPSNSSSATEAESLDLPVASSAAPGTTP